jgi:hypothetical protein
VRDWLVMEIVIRQSACCVITIRFRGISAASNPSQTQTQTQSIPPTHRLRFLGSFPLLGTAAGAATAPAPATSFPAAPPPAPPSSSSIATETVACCCCWVVLRYEAMRELLSRLSEDPPPPPPPPAADPAKRRC